MTKSDIQRVIGSLEPESGFALNVNKYVKRKPHLFICKPAFVFISCLLLLASTIIVSIGEYKRYNSSELFIPQVKISASADMNLMIIYGKRIYTKSQIVTYDIALKLEETKIGTTKYDLNESTLQNSNYSELSSNIGKFEVYSLKGYDRTFRIMAIVKDYDGKNYGYIFDCLNGINVKTGTDYFGKLNLVDNIQAAVYYSFENQKNGESSQITKITTIKNISLVNRFVKALDASTPYLQKSYSYQGICKVLTLTMQDGTTVEFHLLEGGYVSFSNHSDVIFKVNEKLFEEIWNAMPA